MRNPLPRIRAPPLVERPAPHEPASACSHRCAEQHPYFKPGMLDPPKNAFKEVSLTDGPILKSHSSKKTGLETKRPYQWGPLGGFY